MPEHLPTAGMIPLPGPTRVSRVSRAVWTDSGYNGRQGEILWTQLVDRRLSVGLWFIQPEGAVTGTGGGDRINAHVS